VSSCRRKSQVLCSYFGCLLYLTPVSSCPSIQQRWMRGHAVSAVRPGAEVNQVLLHEAAALAVLQWVPAPGWAPAAKKELRAAETLSAADALAAKQLLRSTVLGIVETVHAAPAATPPHAPLHTSLPFWALQPGGCASVLCAVSRHVHRDSGQVKLTAGQCCTMTMLTRRSGRSDMCW
jgi:hypothetical protein